MFTKDFNYELPIEYIAQKPLAIRSMSKLMLVDPKNKTMEHKIFSEIINYLQAGDVLVFNNTKVIPARLQGKKATGAKIEVFLLSRIVGDDWEVLVKPGRKALVGTVINFSDNMSCEIISATDFGGRIARFSYTGIFEELLADLGQVPLPPYIKEELQDIERYQTVYAKEQGSVAAPTAGLHFTPELLEQIKNIGVEFAFVTLDIGLGTFRPVNAATIAEHKMHSEKYFVSEENAAIINRAKQEKRRIIAVGTTSVRVLESATDDTGYLQSGVNATDIFIYPGYKFKMTNAIITNLHLPQSTLLMLICSFGGQEFILEVYKAAVENKYRFFSFGDAMFLAEDLSKE